ncbi:MAG: hypothetical protein JXQ65_12170 [Candidatus Marinimicrobia bacterium]|nr:hypothetical protein [Candidatus Neomarinimicrobiota bacterium]
MRDYNFKYKKEVMDHINTIAEEYRKLVDQADINAIHAYNELENIDEVTQEQILSDAIDETDQIMFQVEDANGSDFIFSEKEIEEIENIIVTSRLDRGILIEQVKYIKNKNLELEKYLDYKKYRLKAKNEKIRQKSIEE